MNEKEQQDMQALVEKVRRSAAAEAALAIEQYREKMTQLEKKLKDETMMRNVCERAFDMVCALHNHQPDDRSDNEGVKQRIWSMASDAVKSEQVSP